jgi:hypothetical protein
MQTTHPTAHEALYLRRSGHAASPPAQLNTSPSPFFDEVAVLDRFSDRFLSVFPPFF